MDSLREPCKQEHVFHATRNISTHRQRHGSMHGHSFRWHRRSCRLGRPLDGSQEGPAGPYGTHSITNKGTSFHDARHCKSKIATYGIAVRCTAQQSSQTSISWYYPGRPPAVKTRRKDGRTEGGRADMKEHNGTTSLMDL